MPSGPVFTSQESDGRQVCGVNGAVGYGRSLGAASAGLKPQEAGKGYPNIEILGIHLRVRLETQQGTAT